MEMMPVFFDGRIRSANVIVSCAASTRAFASYPFVPLPAGGKTLVYFFDLLFQSNLYDPGLRQKILTREVQQLDNIAYYLAFCASRLAQSQLWTNAVPYRAAPQFRLQAALIQLSPIRREDSPDAPTQELLGTVFCKLITSCFSIFGGRCEPVE